MLQGWQWEPSLTWTSLWWSLVPVQDLLASSWAGDQSVGLCHCIFRVGGPNYRKDSMWVQESIWFTMRQFSSELPSPALPEALLWARAPKSPKSGHSFLGEAWYPLWVVRRIWHHKYRALREAFVMLAVITSCLCTSLKCDIAISAIRRKNCSLLNVGGLVMPLVGWTVTWVTTLSLWCPLVDGL